MFFNQGFKDTLTLRRQRRRRPWLMTLLLLALAILAVGLGRHAWQAGWLQQSRPPARAATPQPERQLLAQVRALLAADDLLAARAQAFLALERSQDQQVRGEVEQLLGQINMRLLLMPVPIPEKVEYIVQAGDSLERIAKRFGTTVELIRAGNKLTKTLIHPGDRLLVLKAKMELFVSKSRNDMLLEIEGRFGKRYAVGTGAYGKTPTGTYLIADKITEPPWWRPDGKMIPYGDKENVLGTRWLALVPDKDTPAVTGYGIHGTWEPDTIGKQASAGCVRLLNSDVEEVFMLVPEGTRVLISE